ncbi:sigma-70 family RNA polymerase sigma factor [Amycolatopsis pithecellobii]|uniref:Sigma-70 family RNA polymerase sigma factor n=1 Tax=Amycolatopsis pithecellobii TaxID=664692 RepID=A0A6N7YZW6_9PSEU|nr:sigma-70 family RNA polymerase sigma factor [Amycolatopsis pithecellobii]MTD54503.1 sigma-70 family RNA polymerase sigma factor [Amycolatopsis pithecellobii]
MDDWHELIGAYLPLVHERVRGITAGLPAYVDVDEITAAGVYALVVSAEACKEHDGYSFWRFAKPRLEKAILAAAAAERGRFMTDARPKAPPPYKVYVVPQSSQAIDNRLPDATPSTEEIVLGRERLRTVRAEIDRLPVRLRKILTGRFLQHRHIADLAAELGISDSRVFQLSTQAVDRLRDRVAARERL